MLERHVDDYGRVAIPKAMLDMLHVVLGESVSLDCENDQIIITKRSTQRVYSDSIGSLYRVEQQTDGRYVGHVKSPGIIRRYYPMRQLQPRRSAEDAQADLDAYAARKGWEVENQ